MLLGLEYIQKTAVGSLNGQQQILVFGSLRHFLLLRKVQLLQVVMCHVGVLRVTRIHLEALLLLLEARDKTVQLVFHFLDLFLLFLNGEVSRLELRIQVTQIL